MSDFVRLNHLTLRDKFDQEKTFFYIETVPAPPRKRIIECQYSIWWIPKKPCHPNQMVQDVTPYKLHVWVMLILVMVVSTMAITASASNTGVAENVKITLFTNLFIIIGIYFRQASGTQSGLKWVMHLTMILTLAVYETYFTSMVVVPSKDFEKLGISDWIKNKKYLYNVRNQKEKMDVMQNLSLKVMTDTSEHSDIQELLNTIFEMDNSHGNMTCKLVPEIFLRTHSYDLAHVSIRASGTQSQLKLVIHLTMILTLAVYETYFTSMVIVPSKVEDNPGFVSLLKSGYKIVFHRALGNGISGWIQNKRYLYNVGNLKDKMQVMRNRSLKVMTDTAYHSGNQELESTKLELDNAHGNMTSANRKSVLKIKIVNRYPKKMEKGEPLAKCTLYVVFTPESNADWEKVESAIFTCTFAYRPDYVSAVILLRPRQFSPPKLTGCKYKTISIRIFSLAVALSYRKVTNIEWSFHCYLCSGRTWISFIANAKMSEIVRLNHLTLRDRLDPKKTFFYIYTAPAPRTNRISGCQYPIWRNPKNPCHPYLMVQEVLTSNLNVTFRNIRSFSDHQCGLLHLNRILMNGTVKWNATGSLKFRQAIVSRFKYCKFGRSSKPGTIQFWAWVTPYKWHVWVVLLLFMVACTMAITASDYNMEVFEFLGNLKMSLINNLFIMIGIHLRQAIGTQSWLKWVIHLTMILTLAVYETYFTSMVVVPSKVEDNPGFASLLKNGYKMVYYRALANVSAREFLEVHVPNYFPKFVKILADSNEKFLLGQKYTWADLHIAHNLAFFEECVDSEILMGYPRLSKFVEDVFAIPQIKRWVATRPQNSDKEMYNK
ncbi:Glutathione S-transferase 1 [Folsomia candida]|uniref:glutathione transferase n=1 Tax=Folsomia candida TaxID=158441 RepID=A0A226DUQ7_FOLCA|nr:Glutathione S-transferase 1 [Folsomia candida]